MVFSPHATTCHARECDRKRSSGTGALGGSPSDPAAGFTALPDRFGCRRGQQDKLIADELGINFKTVASLWRKRFVSEGPDCLGELTGKRIRRGVFVSVEDLQQAIEEFLAAWNDDPKPFVWTATVESIVEKLSRCRQTLERIKPGCTRPRSRKNRGK